MMQFNGTNEIVLSEVLAELESLKANQIVWTDEKPKEPGWYWYCYPIRSQAFITYVSEYNGHLWMSDGHSVRVDLMHGEWSTRIPNPTEKQPPTPQDEQ